MVQIAPGRGLQGRLIYRTKEHSFDFESSSSFQCPARTSLQFGTLQLEVALPVGTALFIWGYHPQELWQEHAVPVPPARPGLLQIQDVGLRPGISVRKVDVGEWITTNDIRSGWLRFGDRTNNEVRYCEFGDDMVAAVSSDGNVRAFYLHPHYL